MSKHSTDGLPRHEVPAAFDTAAAGYDRLVGINPGYHRQLRKSASRLQLPNRGAGMRLLDVGCGTGASTKALLRAAPEAEITAVDASGEMLEQARRKAFPPSVRFVHARVEDLEAAGVDGPFDAILAAYLIRNLATPDVELRRLFELLRPGGRLAVHEYSVSESARARLVWDAVAWSVIIPTGRIVTGTSELYRHLWQSVRSFDGVTAFERRLADAGFTEVRTAGMTGWQRGIAHTFLAARPVPADG
ncbi:class I SAM-dependent methyltransferase [Kribbella deserti]|uniref:Class I SAM-dependent methyltransferase n=1 Tax=Kribbella deserti TaxID=1926257 RepID=A0ABV6QP94_9ACTN